MLSSASKQAKLSMAEFARKLGVDRSTYSKWERGLRKPSAERTEQLRKDIQRVCRDVALGPHYPKTTSAGNSNNARTKPATKRLPMRSMGPKPSPTTSIWSTLTEPPKKRTYSWSPKAMEPVVQIVTAAVEALTRAVRDALYADD
jgi:transcriptional regulator with XRE-family HTH domain